MTTRYLCDVRRHLICEPYSYDGLQAMARDLEIGRHWFHPCRLPHYDIPNHRIADVTARCVVVPTREIVRITRSAVTKIEVDEPLCWLPGHEPRKRPAPKPPEVMADIRARAWATRRAKYGDRGHR